MYRKKYHDDPAQPGMVVVSSGFPSGSVHWAARAKGGSPLSVGKYLSTSGSTKGSRESGNKVGTPPA